MADLDCWNPNCNNKAQSEDALTCAGCTLALETTDAGICEACKCWTETAKCNPSDGTPYCPACYKVEVDLQKGRDPMTPDEAITFMDIHGETVKFALYQAGDSLADNRNYGWSTVVENQVVEIEEALGTLLGLRKECNDS